MSNNERSINELIQELDRVDVENLIKRLEITPKTPDIDMNELMAKFKDIPGITEILKKYPKQTHTTD